MDRSVADLVETRIASLSARQEKQLHALRQQLVRQEETQRSMEVESRLMAKELEVMFKSEILDFTQEMEGKFADVEEGQGGVTDDLDDDMTKRIEDMKAWHEGRMSELQAVQRRSLDGVKEDLADLRAQLDSQEETVVGSIEELVSAAKRDGVRVKRLEDRLKNVEFTIEERLSAPAEVDEEHLNSLLDKRLAPLAEQQSLSSKSSEANMAEKVGGCSWGSWGGVSCPGGGCGG